MIMIKSLALLMLPLMVLACTHQGQSLSPSTPSQTPNISATAQMLSKSYQEFAYNMVQGDSRQRLSQSYKDCLTAPNADMDKLMAGYLNAHFNQEEQALINILYTKDDIKSLIENESFDLSKINTTQLEPYSQDIIKEAIAQKLDTRLQDAFVTLITGDDNLHKQIINDIHQVMNERLTQCHNVK